MYIGLQPLIKTSIFNLPGSKLLPSTNLVFCEAPTSRAPTLSSQGTNLVFRSTNSKDTNPSNSEAPTPRAPTLSCQGTYLVCFRLQPSGYQPYGIQPTTIFCQDTFDSNSLLPKSSLLNSVNLQLHCSLHVIASMATCLHMKEYSQLFILSTQSLQSYFMMISNSHHDLQ